MDEMLKSTDTLIEFGKTWTAWLKSFKHFMEINASTFELLNNIDISLLKDIRSPSGKASEEISNHFPTGASKAKIRISTIHSIKGETIDAALLVSTPDMTSKGGHWKHWLASSTENPEYNRFAYVASSRPKHLLAWAIPYKKNENYDCLTKLGFVIKNDWLS